MHGILIPASFLCIVDFVGYGGSKWKVTEPPFGGSQKVLGLRATLLKFVRFAILSPHRLIQA
jgi:hypothetical protein